MDPALRAATEEARRRAERLPMLARAQSHGVGVGVGARPVATAAAPMMRIVTSGARASARLSPGEGAAPRPPTRLASSPCWQTTLAPCSRCCSSGRSHFFRLLGRVAARAEPPAAPGSRGGARRH